jgi:hypothetical protein
MAQDKYLAVMWHRVTCPSSLSSSIAGITPSASWPVGIVAAEIHSTGNPKARSFANASGMCYYRLTLYMLCGHGEHSQQPLKGGPPCPNQNKAKSEAPTLSSPVSPVSPSQSVPTKDDPQKENRDPENPQQQCVIKNAHPVYTYRIESLCRACDQERWRRLAKFEIGAIEEGVERGFVKARQKERVEFQGRKLRPLQAGRREGQSTSAEKPPTEEKPAGDAKSIESFGGETLAGSEEDSPERATTSGRNSLVDASKLRRRSTLKSSNNAAGCAVAVQSEKQPSASMATLIQSLFGS